MNCQDFEKMIRSMSPNDRSEIIAHYFKNKIIFNNDECFLFEIMQHTNV